MDSVTHGSYAVGGQRKVQKQDITSAVRKAIQQEDTKAIADLAASGADVNTGFGPSGTVLLDATVNLAGRCNLRMIRALVAAGAPVNGRNSGGVTPLHRASEGCNADCIKTLIAAGANVNARDVAQKTPFHHLALPAVGYESRAVVPAITALASRC